MFDAPSVSLNAHRCINLFYAPNKLILNTITSFCRVHLLLFLNNTIINNYSG